MLSTLAFLAASTVGQIFVVNPYIPVVQLQPQPVVVVQPQPQYVVVPRPVYVPVYYPNYQPVYYPYVVYRPY